MRKKQKLLQYEQSKTLSQGEDEGNEEENDNIIAPAKTTSDEKAVVVSMNSVRQKMNCEPVNADDYMDHYLLPLESTRKSK